MPDELEIKGGIKESINMNVASGLGGFWRKIVGVGVHVKWESRIKERTLYCTDLRWEM